MGKHRKSSASGSKPAAQNDATDFPSFDEKALCALTEKIEKRFGKSKDPQKDAGIEENARKITKVSEPSKSKYKSTIQEPGRGTKRDARGNKKAHKGGNANTGSLKQQGDGNAHDDKATLLQEILALGGTEEDLELVANAFSDDEGLDAENSAQPDKSFRKDLANFVASLGIEGKVDEAVGESEVEEVKDEWEEASTLDSVSESANGVEVAEVSQTLAKSVPDTKNGPASKNTTRLVGTSSARATV
jgi:ribosome biogenesis protein MAK21